MIARGLSWCAWPARVKRNRISISKGAQKRQRGRTVARSTLCEKNETQKSVICGEHARSGTARNIDSERATLSIESRRTDTLRRAVREDDQRTMMLDVTERQGSQQSKRERSRRPMRAECNPHHHRHQHHRQRIAPPIVGALTFCPLVLISYHYFLFLSTYYYMLQL
jgi:hypothetical protein